jgi:crotonobetainyl-CoA:carnitine CoA-transferase CaiB-like acyl-CoA transferase
VPCGPINSIADIFEDEHFKARGNLARVSSDGAGEVVVPSVLPRLSRTPGRIDHLGRHKGEDTNSILGELLDMPAERIADLKAKGVI